jgi:outer membrane protein OmpA-like peptidoglycan-associated protein
MSKAQQGAIIGGVAGAVLGKTTGNKKNKRAIIGGVIGAVAGAAIGGYMDKQEQELNRELEGSGVGVEREGNNINLNMPGNITFDTNRANIKPNFYPVLDDVARVLAKYDKTYIEVQGHTDSVGSNETNQQLSKHRAASVASALRTRGVNGARISSVGFGESMPIASNDTTYGREQNRRVEIKIIPNSAN